MPDIWKKCYATNSDRDDVYEISNKAEIRVIRGKYPVNNRKYIDGELTVRLMDRYCLQKIGYRNCHIRELLEDAFPEYSKKQIDRIIKKYIKQEKSETASK